jgi:S1-C subfamily serine protease
MYYENQKAKKKTSIALVICLILIIFLLITLNLKFDTSNYNFQTDYNTQKISTKSFEDETEETDIENRIESASESIVGISKLKQNGTSIFLSDSEISLGLGSGVIVTEDGYILTNEHVAGSKYSNCYVTLENGENYTGRVVWADSNIDIAIVKIASAKLKYLSLGDSDALHLAEDVYAIGNPVGFEFQRSVTKGIVSGLNRTIKIEEDGTSTYMEDLIQTDATINEGNSGGALITKNGELIGINSIKITSAEGMGFAVPVNIIKPIIEKLEKDGKFEESYLGIYGYDKEVIPYMNSSLKFNYGIYVAEISTDGPLYNSELNVGDIITKIDDTEISKMNDLRKYIYTKSPGDSVNLEVERNGKVFNILVKLGYKM